MQTRGEDIMSTKIRDFINQKLTEHLHTLRWLAPLATAVLVFIYELGPARWLHFGLGMDYHILVEILFFGTMGPLVAFFFLEFLARWLEERETSELQAQILAQAREQLQISHDLTDSALQTLFAASTVIASLKQDASLRPESAAALTETEKAIDTAINNLRSHLLEATRIRNGWKGNVLDSQLSVKCETKDTVPME